MADYKITPKKKRAQGEREQIKAKTKDLTQIGSKGVKWWKLEDSKERAMGLLSTYNYLKQNQQYRQRQMAIFARLYGNLNIFNFVGANLNKLGIANALPVDRPTMNVIQSGIDTLTSQITQNRPRPVFQTFDGDYNQRQTGKDANKFIMGEFFRLNAYDALEDLFRDGAVDGHGCLKILEQDNKVMIERRLCTELYVDHNDGAYGCPRQLIEAQLVDRDVAMAMFPKFAELIKGAESATLDSSGDSSETISDQIILVEGWHLRSGEKAKDGRHTIACSAGEVYDDSDWDKDKFPYVFFPYSKRMLGFWGQGAAEQLMGTQISINRMLQTAEASINFAATPRVWLEDSSKVSKAHINNSIGSIGTYRGTPPIFSTGGTGLQMDFYEHLQRLVNYAYQQLGISQLSASQQKPAGLNSGEAQREYKDTQTDRFATIARRYDELAVELAYQILDKANDIKKRTGKYETMYLGEDKSVNKIELPSMEKLKNGYVIQCADASMLPRDPAGRKQEVIDRMQAGLLTLQEGRRLLSMPDLEQEDKLLNAGEERIYKYLDEIVIEGKYNPPDPMMDPQMAVQKATEYYNYYVPRELEEKKVEMLKDFRQQALDLIQASMLPAPAPMPGAQVPAVPEQPPVSDMMPINQPPIQ